MHIGIPREIKTLEGRVALIPAACADLVANGHDVFIETDAGILSGYHNQDYQAVGVQVLPSARAVYEAAQLILKVKEPLGSEWEFFRSDHLLFCFLHLAAEPELMQALLDIGLTAIGFETIEQNAELPLLKPMSMIAGRLATQVGATLLMQPQGGQGVLMGGLGAGVRGNVVVIGAGMAGSQAALMASAMGANVTVFDTQWERLQLMQSQANNITALYAYQESIKEVLPQTDLLIGAVLVVGQRAPHVVDKAMIETMQAGSAVIDISVDQGGCIETTKPTTYAIPTYTYHDVTHFAVTNMPGAVPRTASQALSAVLLPYVNQLAKESWRDNSVLVQGINVENGKIIHPALNV
ncbi:alanine dehydrogenase [Candidatus Albibeggiatoa sp. nov. BB20]|uniref:alanine dehydrogenase n=1 Tax=Candidatus Albibeggiatoa sp. nov. BB20 TaxID=3162723 RepID=UPI00336580D1